MVYNIIYGMCLDDILYDSRVANVLALMDGMGMALAIAALAQLKASITDI